MKGSWVRWMVALLLLGSGSVAQAADWVSIQGVEPDDPDKSRLRSMSFAQISAEAIASSVVDGLSEPLSDYNGQRAAFNLVPGSTSPWRISLRRLRVGVRGVIPHTDDLVSTAMAVEIGQNPLTTTATDGWRPKLMDASITLRSPWGVHLRVGQFKLPLSDEVLEAFHITTDLVRFSPVIGRLLMERDASSGAFTGRINAFRDVGAQLFGSHQVQSTEVAWAAMVSHGSVDLNRVEPGADVSGRVQVARLFEGNRRDPYREEIAFYGFGTTGQRYVGEGRIARRIRAGGGAQLQHSGIRVRAEGVWAQGVLATGRAPPFVGGALTMDPDGTAWGATALASARFDGTWEVGLAASHLDSLPDGEARRRVFQDLTAFGQLHLSPHAWFDLNLAWRDGRAPEGGDDARRILDTMGPYGALMVTVIP